MSDKELKSNQMLDPLHGRPWSDFQDDPRIKVAIQEKILRIALEKGEDLSENNR